MQSLSQRVQPRVKYPVDVRLIAPGLHREVSGRSLNVSASGIFVEARELVDIGTEIWCDLPLPGGTRRLPGRVARLQPLPFSSDRVGLGIRFVNLDEGSRTLLSNLVDREADQGHLAEASFEGLPGSLRSQAILTPEGARLSLALPFLRPGAEVKVAFLSGHSQVAAQGRVREAQMEGRLANGAPRLTVEVEMVRDGFDPLDDGEPLDDITAVDTPRALQAAKMVAAARTERATAVAARPQRAPREIDRSSRRTILRRGRPRQPTATAKDQVAAGAAAAATTVDASALSTRTGVKVGLVVTGALACFALGGISARLWPRAELRPEPLARTAGDERPVTVAPSRLRTETTPAPVEGSTAALDRAPTPLRRVIARPMAEEAPPPAPARAPSPLPSTRPPAGTSYTEAALRAAVPVPEGTPGPALVREGDELVAVVPFDGPAEGWRHYLLSEPRAVAVNIPGGRAALALGRHAFANEGFRGVWVREHEHGGIQIRFTLAFRTPEVRGVEVRDGTVRVRVAPAAP